MSTEKVAHFVKAVSEKPELNKKVAAAEKSTTAWVQLGKQAGFEFSNDEFVGFVSQVTGSKATEKDAVTLLLGHGTEMSDQQLDQVAGGVGGATASLNFSTATLSRLGSAFNIGAAGDVFVKTSGPSFVKSGSVGGSSIE
jgi:predicted ribosomally synthesized peptide with nif11-like leader